MTTRRTFASAALALAAATALAACNNFLSVDNPGAIKDASLTDSTNIPLMVNGVIGAFQPMYTATAMWSSILSDESRNAHVNISYRPIDLRQISNENDIDALVYNPMQKARYLADTVSDRLKGFLGDNAATDVRVARTLAYAGYSYVVLGENMCEAPIQLSAAHSSAELFGMAIPRFDEAIAIGRVVKGTKADTLAGDSLVNLALVGAARASLDAGDMAKAVSYASQVSPGFQFDVLHIESNAPAYGSLVNPYFNAMGSPSASTGAGSSGGYLYNAGALYVVVGEAFQGINDPRVPMTPTPVKAMDGTMEYVANQPTSFSGYTAPTASVAGTAMTRGANVRLASYLEAQYIIAEANGGADPGTFTFVNSRRAAGGQPPLVIGISADSVMAELRDQRRRDFYLDGHRLGDLRRYKALYNIDLFPTGQYPGTTTNESYGDSECWPVPISEYNSNPNLNVIGRR